VGRGLQYCSLSAEMSPHKALKRKTPKEAFSGSRPDVEHRRIFGCSTFSHVPSEKRTKLDPTAKRGMLAGYSREASLRRSLDCIRFLVYLLVAFAFRSPYIYLSLLLVFPMGVFPGSR